MSKEYYDLVDCLAEVNLSLDYELSPGCTGACRWEGQILRLYKARDEMLEMLKKYRR